MGPHTHAAPNRHQCSWKLISWFLGLLFRPRCWCGWGQGCLNRHHSLYVAQTPLARPSWLCSLLQLISFTCLVMMEPHNQNFQEYSVHRAPWTMTCFTLAAERIQAMPQSSLFYSLVSPWPTRSGSPVWCLLNVLTSVCFRLTCLLLQFLGFSVGQPKPSWGGECSSLCSTVPASHGPPHLC